MRYDVVVVGLGGMGSAVAAHLAKRGKRVLGIERLDLGHDLGASAGRTRIIRKAYFEGAQYVPLLQRSYELWRALEIEANETLLDMVGVLMIGAPSGSILDGVRASVQRYGIDIREIDRAHMRSIYPQFRLLDGEIALYEPDAGIVFPERSIAAHQRVAREHGADLRGGSAVEGWRREPGGAIQVERVGGEIVEAEQLVFCAGPWLGAVAGDLNLPLTVQRNVQVWFAPERADLERDRLPAFFLDRPDLPRPLYGFPDVGDGIKAALHGYGASTDPDRLDREIHTADVAAVRSVLDGLLPGAAGKYRFGKVCMYALTPDEHFIVDRHPHDAGVIIAGGFSGHGYKFCPVIGEIVADLIDGIERPDAEFLTLRRFPHPTLT